MNDTKSFKQEVHQHCLETINSKINSLRLVLADLKESASNETKSTAGDKHETALAMLQIEQKNTAAQLDHLLLQQKTIARLLPVVHQGKITNGSLVKTNKGHFYLSIALGKLQINGISIIALSPESPLGQRLMGSAVKDSFVVNGINYMIEDIQ